MYAKWTLSENSFSAESNSASLRVAIIGAGASGTSVVHWLKQASRQLGAEITVNLYQRSSYIDGRPLDLNPHDDPAYSPIIEMGGTSFAVTDRNLTRAATEFGLEVESYEPEDDGITATWDSTSLRSLCVELGLPAFGTLPKQHGAMGYLPTFPPSTSSGSSVAHGCPLRTASAGLTDQRWVHLCDKALDVSAGAYLSRMGIRDAYMGEVLYLQIQAKYGQNLYQIHALAALHSLGVERRHMVSGNVRIFKGIVLCNTPVIRLVSPAGKKTWLFRTSDAKAPRSGNGSQPAGNTTPSYNHVIVATTYLSVTLNLLPHPEAVALW
ncbi:hypothetical protein BOTBODRAFT_172979 [Botryobasidium botryosum FD-172 SS1]|uniref:Uncharacterized protein n=1 Tax=Botryobasidium botryosum (strain FD-172 SS1) TaxID=930990 RepID=A0A067ML16_BOTB1|nr:hypothetical protein BOTBODRAFT_172979 [Botryobasidium botryosum FD-172 SS1]